MFELVMSTSSKETALHSTLDVFGSASDVTGQQPNTMQECECFASSSHIPASYESARKKASQGAVKRVIFFAPPRAP